MVQLCTDRTALRSTGCGSVSATRQLAADPTFGDMETSSDASSQAVANPPLLLSPTHVRAHACAGTSTQHFADGQYFAVMDITRGFERAVRA